MNETRGRSQDSGRHPDKICDQMADTELDEPRQACFGLMCKITCETSVNNNTILVASETTIAGQIDHETVVQDVEKNTGLDSSVDDLSNMNSRRPYHSWSKESEAFASYSAMIRRMTPRNSSNHEVPC